ncbi:2-oxo-4-hydroxy-4-carboxy-5-ureidoimidazoline decarboxylase-like [Periplaneta americana]|uniref:2-oxo-4-hydroxy-4-carboxy-5-ureidoimidazoline decarboxylase-like n=1 Tax=Periplaneta americana TaxID=6978 RepID=UPI0037E89A4D
MEGVLRVEEVNALGNEQFVWIFNNIVESYPSVATTISKQRPFASADHLADAAAQYLDQLTPPDKEEVLRLHPDLAGRLADEGKLTSESTMEQRSAGLHNLSPEDKAKINQLNASYQEKFGFPFVICARENKAAAILQGLQTRLHNSREKELETGIAEVKKICRLRVKALVLSEN